MTKARLILIAAFCVVFVAGTFTGAAFMRTAEKPRERHSWLAKELDLTPGQQKQLYEIWSEAGQSMRAARDEQRRQQRALRAERDEAVQALLTEEQKEHHAEVMAEYERRSAELDGRMREAFAAAREKTMQVLSEEQQAQYEELMNRRGDWHSRRGDSPRRDGRRHRPGTDSPNAPDDEVDDEQEND